MGRGGIESMEDKIGAFEKREAARETTVAQRFFSSQCVSSLEAK